MFAILVVQSGQVCSFVGGGRGVQPEMYDVRFANDKKTFAMAPYLS